MERRISGAVALITGANGGIGRAIASRLASEGYRLVLTDAIDCAPMIAELGLGESVLIHSPCDLGSSEAVAEFATTVLARTPVDILINVAADMQIILYDDLDVERFARYNRVNTEAPYQLSKAFTPGMVEKGWGRIVNVVSGVGWRPKDYVGYTASKMALVGMTRSMAVALGSDGITVNALTPTVTRHPGNWHDLPDERWAAAVNQQAIHRQGKPEDVVGGVSFLISDDAAFMTGQNLVIDGGLLFL